MEAGIKTPETPHTQVELELVHPVTTHQPYVETVAIVELVRNSDIPQLDKCCYCIDLKLGLNIWLAFESFLWFVLLISAFYYEIIYTSEIELVEFVNEFDDWYFYLVYGDRFYFLDQKIRSK